ncbi:MAG: 3-hydroxyisobutyrate dehydrogenase [Pseudomonadota bacterium]
MAHVAFIGLGNMGAPMAENLKKHHIVKGFDLSPEARAAFSGAVGSLDEALAGADTVITMLPAGAAVRAVLVEGAVFDRLSPGSLVIDCSTIDVASARAVAAAAHAAGHTMCDAPVSGGVSGAAAATLTFMVGGSEGAFASARPLLETMGKTVVHAGEAGAGQAAKICNNMILGISMLAVCEAFNLADGLGLERQKLFDIAATASGQCWSLTTYCPVPGPVPTSPANRGYAPGFTAAMMLKDLALAQGAAGEAQVTTPMGERARALYEAYCEAGGAATDFSGIIEGLRKDL